jgi:hypothetical protein
MRLRRPENDRNRPPGSSARRAGAMTRTVAMVINSLDGAGTDADVDELVEIAAGSRSTLIDAEQPLVERLHLRPDDFAATHGLQQLHRALMRVDRELPVILTKSRRIRRRSS